MRTDRSECTDRVLIYGERAAREQVDHREEITQVLGRVSNADVVEERKVRRAAIEKVRA